MSDSIAIGVTCAPRASKPYLQTSFESLRNAGFEQPVHLFCEPGTGETPVHGSLRVDRPKTLGCFQNFNRSLVDMLDMTDADWILMLQDDVIWRNDGAERMQQAVGRWSGEPDIGVLSPYCGRAMVGKQVRIRKMEAWHDAVFYNNAFWGALALCFPRKAAEEMVCHQRWVSHDHHRKVDVLVGNVLKRELGRRVLVHAPSLCNHIGEISTLGRHKVKGISWGRRGFNFREEA